MPWALPDGRKLTQFVILERKNLLKVKLPRGIILKCTEKGHMIEKLMVELLREVWYRNAGCLFQQKEECWFQTLSTVTLHEKVQTESSTAKTQLVITPGGMTCQLQVPDAVTKPFTDYVICTENGSCLTCPVKPAGNMISLSQALLGSGFKMLGMTFHPIPFSRFFRKCCASSYVNGTNDDLWDKDHEENSSCSYESVGSD